MYSVALGKGWVSIVGIPYGVSAFCVVLSGLFILHASEESFKSAKRAGWMVLLMGLHEMDYPFLRGVDWFAPIGFTLGAILTVLLVYFMACMCFPKSSSS